MKHYKVGVGSVAFAIAFSAIGQTLDGQYEGTLSCGQVLNQAQSQPFGHAIAIRVDGDSVFWTRDVGDTHEAGANYLDGSQFLLDVVGESRARLGERWRVQGFVEFANQRVSGDVGLLSFDGSQRHRECSVSAWKSVAGATQVRSAPQTGRQNGDSSLRDRGVPSTMGKSTASDPPSRAQQDALMAVPFGTKSDDMCLDSICLEDDAGLLGDKGVDNPTSQMIALEAMARKDKKALDTVFMVADYKYNTCVDLYRKQWGSRANKLCEILAQRLLRPLDRSDFQFLKDNPGPICVYERESYEVVKTTPLGQMDIELKFAIDGRLRVYKISKVFEVDRVQEKEQLRTMLAQKHRPYLSAGSTVNPSPAPWGGTVQMHQNANARLVMTMIAMSSRFAAKPTIEACEPPRKTIGVK